MKLWRTLGLSGFASFLLLAPICKADDADALKAKDLVKTGTSYVLPAEQELTDGMKNLRKLKAKLDVDARQRRELEGKLKIIKNAMSAWDHELRQKNEAFLKLKDVSQKNDAVVSMNLLNSKLKEANGIRE